MGNSLYVPNLKFELVLLAKGRMKTPTHTTGVSEALLCATRRPHACRHSCTYTTNRTPFTYLMYAIPIHMWLHSASEIYYVVEV